MLSIFRISSYLLLSIASLSMFISCAQNQPPKPWIGTLRQELGSLGARNWVVIGEAAFPVQSRRGLKVIQIDADIPEVLETIEDVMEEKHHVKPRVYVTAELGNVPYDYAPGIQAHKKKLKESLHGRETVTLDNDMLMRMLADTSRSYRVLVIKTRTALPYSTVFMELGSGYWDAESESALRSSMDKTP